MEIEDYEKKDNEKVRNLAHLFSVIVYRTISGKIRRAAVYEG